MKFEIWYLDWDNDKVWDKYYRAGSFKDKLPKNFVVHLKPGYRKVGTVMRKKEPNIKSNLEWFFARWNYGSGVESTVFKRARVRSMSVGDLVKAGHTWYMVMGFGFDKVPKVIANA